MRKKNKQKVLICVSILTLLLWQHAPDVAVVASVSEPSSLLLAMVGMTGFLGFRRRPHGLLSA